MSIWCKYMSLCFLFRVVISALIRCSVRLYSPFCRGFVFYFCYLYLFKHTAIYYIYIYIQYIILLYFSYFFLYKFYCNKNTISIVSFNLSEKYYSPVNSTNDYSPAGEYSCNNVAPVTNLCLGRATTRSHSSQWSKKKSCSWNIKIHYLRFKHFIITITDDPSPC